MRFCGTLQMNEYKPLIGFNVLTSLKLLKNVIENFTYDKVYKQGLNINTPINLEFQKIATNSLRNGLISYDQRKGWRGPLTNKIYNSNWNKDLKKYNLEKLIKSCRNYPKLSNSRRITWEYVMLKGVNDTAQDAKNLVKLIKGIPSKINLIPFNEWPCSPYECSEEESINNFAKIIMKAGYASPVRTPRGRDVMAACGQLKSLSIKQKKLNIKTL